MNQIRIITSHWEDDITPLLDRILANQTDDDSSLRAEAIVWLRDLELDFNQMVMDRELARIDQAEVVNNDTIEVLANQRTLIIVLGIFLVLFF